MHKNIVGYRLSSVTDSSDVVFQGEDFSCSPMHAIDSDETVRAILTFLTLRKGDTDAEYFENYTPRQIRFRDYEAEELSLYSLNETDGGPSSFEDFIPIEVSARVIDVCLCGFFNGRSPRPGEIVINVPVDRETTRDEFVDDMVSEFDSTVDVDDKLLANVDSHELRRALAEAYDASLFSSLESRDAYQNGESVYCYVLVTAEKAE